jgi:hypothetical protein
MRFNFWMIGTTNLARTDASHLVFHVGELPATGLRGLLELLLSIVSSSPSTLGFCPYTTVGSTSVATQVACNCSCVMIRSCCSMFYDSELHILGFPGQPPAPHNRHTKIPPLLVVIINNLLHNNLIIVIIVSFWSQRLAELISVLTSIITRLKVPKISLKTVL